MNVNRLPARTWEWLRVNETKLDEVPAVSSFEYREEKPDEIRHGSGIFADYRTGLGDEFNEAVKSTGLPVNAYSVDANVTASAPLYQDFDIPSGAKAGSLINLEVGPNASCTVIQFISSAGEEGGCSFLLQNKYHIAENGNLTLIQVQNLSCDSVLLNDCGGVCEDGANFHRIQIVLGGGTTHMGEFCSLDGEKSTYKCDLGYRIEGRHVLDMNYVADHNGRLSESDISVLGVMSDKSEKIFRGTIDFHKGCAGARGAELEEVLLLSDDIVNKTVPLILCDEEDVEGSHGATIGRLDENLLFYMKSRGIGEDEIYAMMAHARIDAVASLIQDMNVRDRVYEMIDGPVRRDCLKQ